MHIWYAHTFAFCIEAIDRVNKDHLSSIKFHRVFQMYTQLWKKRKWGPSEIMAVKVASSDVLNLYMFTVYAMNNNNNIANEAHSLRWPVKYGDRLFMFVMRKKNCGSKFSIRMLIVNCCVFFLSF